MSKEIKVFVGSTPQQLIPSLVLAYSIKKYTKIPSTVTPLYKLNLKYKNPKDISNQPRTPFSFQRFFIPSLTDGVAFYMDSDMLVLKDMAPLLDYSFDGYDGLSAAGMSRFPKWGDSNYAMLMLDCDNIGWDIDSIVSMLDSGELTYAQLMFEFKHAKINSSLGENGQWNSLDCYTKKETALLHYTDMGRQPWLFAHHPHEQLWVDHLLEAIESGFIEKSLYQEHVSNRWVRNFMR